MKARRGFLLAARAVIIIILAAGVYYRYNPAASFLFPQCPLKALTGLSCPGCGIQRAFHAVLNGHLSEALSYNYFFILSIPYAVAIVIAWVLKGTGRAPRTVLFLEHEYGIYTYMILFTVWFVVRNILNI